MPLGPGRIIGQWRTPGTSGWAALMTAAILATSAGSVTVTGSGGSTAMLLVTPALARGISDTTATFASGPISAETGFGLVYATSASARITVSGPSWAVATWSCR